MVKGNMSLPVNSRFIYQKYWEISTSVLTLSRLNELVQAHRDNMVIVQTLLKTILVLQSSEQGLNVDSSDSAGDILNLLTQTITSVSPTDAAKTNYLKVCLNVLCRIQSIAPEARSVTAEIVKDLFRKIEQLLGTE